MGGLHPLDWAILVLYFAAMAWIGVRYSNRAGRDLEEYFLSGRALPWWIAGTSMVATSFSCDTPLLVSGWVRDFGIWKNWAWWCFAISGCLQVFLFAPWWRRAGVMTKAELVELRYGGAGARFLRGALGALHALVTNTLTMAWVLLAASKIASALFDADKTGAIVLASLLALFYSITAGFWGVVVTDLVQFPLAMLGAVVLAWIVWGEVGSAEGVLAAETAGRLPPEALALWPPGGPGGLLDASFWTVSLAAAAVYLGVSWWATESVDCAGPAVQRIAASRDEREGLLSMLWFNVAHYALRPWFWIAVGIASLLVLPSIEVRSEIAGTVRAIEPGAIVLGTAEGAQLRVELDAPPSAPDWRPEPLSALRAGQSVAPGEVLARTDSERAYVVLLRRYLPIGLFGLVLASLLAAFMSTIDTHINLAASFFVNDVYRRFLRPRATTEHHILVARLASAGALAIAAWIAAQTESIRDLFLYFLALLGGVGPVYLLRWVWWRVRASTEITAMAASLLATTALSDWNSLWDSVAGTLALPRWSGWPLGPLSPGGELAPEGRLLLVVGFSLLCALASLALTRAPDPAALVPFYRKVRPIGFWGPVRALAGDAPDWSEVAGSVRGTLGSLLLVYGLALGAGAWLLARWPAFALSALAAACGGWIVARSVRRLAA